MRRRTARRSPSSTRTASRGSSATGCRRFRRARCSAPQLADHWFDVHTGGDLAFLIGVFRALVEAGGIDEAFVRDCTEGFTEARDRALASDWDALERDSGATRDRMQAFARLLIDRPNAVIVWSMGLTQHAHGVDTIKALMNVGLARGLPGRPNRGLVPIRGHSGVQGGAEVGCVPKLDAATTARCADVWGFPFPSAPGWTTSEMIDHAAQGDVDLFWIVGGNFLETLPDAERCRRALQRPRLRIHQDIVLSSSMLVDGDGDVLILPATTRYESAGGGTETSTERRIIFSPEIPGRRIGSARPEWQVFGDVMARAFPDRAGARSASRAPRPSAPRSRARCRSTKGSRRCAPKAIRSSGAAARCTPTAASRRRTARRISRRSRHG